MTVLQRAMVSLAVIAPVSIAAARTTNAAPSAGGQDGASRASGGEKARAAPSKGKQAAPLAAELERLKRAIVARDVDQLETLLSPDGVECGDYLYGRAEYDVLVRRPDGRMRPWLFGAGTGGRTSVRTYLDSVVPVIATDSATHRTAQFPTASGSLLIGFTLTGGRWLVTEGLFCE